MKYFLLVVFSLFFISNLSAQTVANNENNNIIRITKKHENNSVIKITKRIDMNRLSLESKIIGKTSLPVLYPFKSQKLLLNGAGLRELLWINVYACGLYLKAPETQASSVIDKNETMIVRMDILSKAVSHSKLVKAFHKGFIDANSKYVVEKLQPEIKSFLKHIEDLELKIGDKIDIVFEPEIGVSLYINYNKIGTVGGLEFKKAILNIWLSNNPVDKSLKSELLDGAKQYITE